jgi:hypothetical protein
MPAFDLALCLRMAWGAAHMTHVAFVQPFGQIADYDEGARV